MRPKMRCIGKPYVPGWHTITPRHSDIAFITNVDIFDGYGYFSASLVKDKKLIGVAFLEEWGNDSYWKRSTRIEDIANNLMLTTTLCIYRARNEK